jgi:hypothetical protein
LTVRFKVLPTAAGSLPPIHIAAPQRRVSSARQWGCLADPDLVTGSEAFKLDGEEGLNLPQVLDSVDSG